MKLSQLVESFVISNDEFEDYLNRATEQLTQELQSGKNPRDAVHDLALTFADQHNKSYDAYTRMSDSLSARMHTLELDGSTSTEIAPADMTNGPDMSDMGDMGAPEMDAEPEMMTDPMGDMEMETPAQDEMPGDSDMEDYAAVMDNEPEAEEVEESINEASCGCCGNDPCDCDDDCDCKKVDEHVEASVNEDRVKVKVVFRKFPDGDVIALFPEEDEGRGMIGSYMTVGQHSEASKSLITDLEPASKEEYADLAAELGRIGYDIVMAESVNEAKSSILDQLKGIVDDKQAKSIKFDDGSAKVDMFTASAITQVYNKVNDDNKTKIEKMLNTRTGLMSIAKVAMGALKEGKLDEVLPAVGAVAGGVARAAVSKGIKGAVTRAGIKGAVGAAKNAFTKEAEDMAGKIVRTSSRQSFSEYNEFYKALDAAAKAGKKAGDTIEVGGKKVKLKSNPKEIHNLSDAEMDKIDALALRLNEKGCSSKYKK